MYYSSANGDILAIWCVMHFVMAMRDYGKIVVIDGVRRYCTKIIVCRTGASQRLNF